MGPRDHFSGNTSLDFSFQTHFEENTGTPHCALEQKRKEIAPLWVWYGEYYYPDVGCPQYKCKVIFFTRDTRDPRTEKLVGTDRRGLRAPWISGPGTLGDTILTWIIETNWRKIQHDAMVDWKRNCTLFKFTKIFCWKDSTKTAKCFNISRI